MLISYEKVFVFIHIFKTGGTSLTQALLPHARVRDRLAYGSSSVSRAAQSIASRLSSDSTRLLTGLRKHASLSEVLDYLGERKFNEMFSFAVVRNPYDWVVSTYFHIARTTDHEHHALTLTGDVNDFVHAYLELNPARQCDYVSLGDAKLRVSFLARHETLDEDWASLGRRLSLPPEELPRMNVGSNRSAKSAEELLSAKSKSLIEDYFRQDFLLLGYPMTGPDRPALQ